MGPAGMRRHRQPTGLDRPTLQQFVTDRLGPAGSPGQLLREMLVRAFGAGSFHQFWRFWNPVYGYYLYYRCYRPLRRHLPRWLCVLLTFALSGFLLHDLPSGWWVRLARALPAGRVPVVALWFSLMGGLTLLSRGLRLDASGRPLWVRVALNVAGIGLPLALAVAITRWVS